MRNEILSPEPITTRQILCIACLPEPRGKGGGESLSGELIHVLQILFCLKMITSPRAGTLPVGNEGNLYLQRGSLLRLSLRPGRMSQGRCQIVGLLQWRHTSPLSHLQAHHCL